MPLHLGDTLAIELAPDSQLSARVVWTNGNQCGVAFDRTVDAEALLRREHESPSGHGRGHRLSSNIAAQLRSDGRLQPTTISNISQQGMMVTHDGGFTPGLPVKVVWDDGNERAAVVQWAHGNFAGLFLFDHFSVMELGDLNCVGRIVT